MKTFTYQVADYEFVDTVAFGTAWTQAKEKATELHTPIYRLVSNGERTEQEFYAKGGCFLNIRYITSEKVNIF